MTKRIFSLRSTAVLRLAALVLLLGAIAFADRASLAAESSKDLPNIIIFLTDDQGYGDVGCFGATEFATPNFDRLAKEGTKFTSFLVAQPVCTASRAALMTGCYANRVGMSGELNHTSRIGINPNELLIPKLCKSKGYA